MPASHRSMKKVLDTLKLELPKVVSHHLLGIKTGPSGRAASARDHWAVSPAHNLCHFFQPLTVSRCVPQTDLELMVILTPFPIC